MHYKLCEASGLRVSALRLGQRRSPKIGDRAQT